MATSMPEPPGLKATLKRGALVAAANWPLVAVQFVAESTLKVLLAVPVVGGIFLVVLLLGANADELLAGDVREVLANASHYLHLLGHVVVAWGWLRMAATAQRAIDANGPDDFHAGKLQACRFFFATELPQTELDARLVAGMDRSAYDMQDGWF